MEIKDRSEISSTTGYLLGIGQIIQALAVPVAVFGQFFLQTEQIDLVVATAAVVLSVGNYIVLYQLQSALFKHGTSEWRNWV
ncbi:hypothetical protein [Haloarcula sediminis]|uniref:hypothetical protein n=1 Tax=Haloarcula sediminis TaxID=3111777 RepID=UPI002D7A1040|nr:hypothetical protein [Haloarcula sp. CK38]